MKPHKPVFVDYERACCMAHRAMKVLHGIRRATKHVGKRQSSEVLFLDIANSIRHQRRLLLISQKSLFR